MCIIKYASFLIRSPKSGFDLSSYKIDLKITCILYQNIHEFHRRISNYRFKI